MLFHMGNYHTFIQLIRIYPCGGTKLCTQGENIDLSLVGDTYFS